VCYRVNGRGIEFLLVQTRGGRWTFPKGSVESGLTHAQAAALEAFEEAGVHGRMEEASFACYIRRQGGGKRRSVPESPIKQLAVHAHLCEVARLGPPQESKRNPTWFSAEKAKRRLQQDRAPDYGAELAGVVDRAVSRIVRLRSVTSEAADALPKDALQKVQFEAVAGTPVQGQIQEASFLRFIRRELGEVGQPAAIELAVNAYLCKLFRLGPKQVAGRSVTSVPQLLSASSMAVEAPHKVTEIDGVRNARGRAKASETGKKNRRTSWTRHVS